ncbi:MAG TPA: ABC transporter ATP-binding protein [Dehalococcoidia bacterium]|jgi:branched-chain amino acid transport system ATP-binding protein
MLKISGVSASYGPVLALASVSLEVPEASIVTLLGSNGAGKTTTLRVVSGLLRPSQGSVEFMGRRIDRRSPEAIVAMGISHIPEGRQLFTDMTVMENLMLGAYTRRDRAGVQRDVERMTEYFPILGERRGKHAGLLSGGEQQQLAIARGLMSRPRLLLLDEPSLGLAPLVIRGIFDHIKRINREDGVTVLLVEQDAMLALSVASYGYVLETGRVAIEDKSERLRADENVRRSYLGY